MHTHPIEAGTSMQDADDSSPRAYAWVVFALTFALLLSDYMSRQVLNAVFPLLKATWGLSDTRLGSLSSIVALMVGVLTFPLSVIADRWGRVRSIVLMAALWSLATLGCAAAASYGQMLLARAFVGVGEAAYGSVGVALIISIFPARLRSTLTGAFMAGGAFGSVLGMAAGGVLAVHMGWRAAFGMMAGLGFVLVLAFRLVVTEARIARNRGAQAPQANAPGAASETRRPSLRSVLAGLFSTVSVNCAYLGSALQLFIMGAVIAWLPSFLNRYYGLPPDRAAVAAAVFVLLGGTGMIVCGMVTDRVSRHAPGRKWTMAIAFSLLSFVLLGGGFHAGPGPLQLVMLGAGIFVVAGTSGPAGAMVANLTHESIHSPAFATLTLVNNLVGLAPGPIVVGFIADRIGLLGALQVAPLVALVAGFAFVLGKRCYGAGLQAVHRRHPVPAPQ
ncbi:putative L-galactonate transporter [Paraburkholderia caffeinitolerans]|uniref:Putative L-galactonate transporter n=1 Tax=Paraburkholderia caffeinitolerans TaxID=1723730 RepID=A0A6J5H1F8_9BURK|nr:putative L-galactonate transporter [Paraburkholderia caffeinitolerans]